MRGAATIAWITLAWGCGHEVEAPVGQVPPKLAAFPPPSGTCWVEQARPSDVTLQYTWDAASRRFDDGDLYWVLDERAKPIEHGALDGSPRELIEYDEHGTQTRLTYEENGVAVPEYGWTQDNRYDADGRLLEATRTSSAGDVLSVVTYAYADGELESVGVHAELPGGRSQQSLTRLLRERGRIASIVTEVDGAVVSREEAAYDGDGHLVQLSIDGLAEGGVDGVPDIVMDWYYWLQDGTLAQLQQDGLTTLGAPVVNGQADLVANFDPRCAEVAVLPREVYHLPSWALGPLP